MAFIVDSNFDTGTGFDGFIRTGFISGDSLFVGGKFDQYSGVTQYDIVQLNKNTAVKNTTFNTGTGFDYVLPARAGVNILSIFPNNDGDGIIVAGEFTKYKGVNVTRAALNLDLSGDTDNSVFNIFEETIGGIDQGFAHEIYNAEKLEDGYIFVGTEQTFRRKTNPSPPPTYFNFQPKTIWKTDFSGETYVGVSDWRTSGLADFSPHESVSTQSNNTSTLPDGSFYVGSDLTSSYNPVLRLSPDGRTFDSGGTYYAFNTGITATTSWTGLQSVCANTVDYSVFVYGKIWDGGPFYTALRLFDVNGVMDSNFKPDIYFDKVKGVRLINDNTQLMVWGSFDEVNGSPQQSLVILNTSDGSNDGQIQPDLFPTGTTIYDVITEDDNIFYVLQNSDIVKGSLTPILPTAPSGVTATTVGFFEAEIEWSDNSYNEDGFYVQHNIGGNWINIVDLPADTTGYTWTGLTPEQSYNIRISAYNEVGESPSESYTFSTLDLPQSWCSLPSGYTVTQGSCGSLNPTTIQIVDYDTYKNFYDFRLIQPSSTNPYQWTYPIGGGYPDANGSFSAQTNVAWHGIEAVPTTSYLRDECREYWILTIPTGSTYVVGDVSKSDAICASFDQQTGRYIFTISGITSPVAQQAIRIWGDQTKYSVVGATPPEYSQESGNTYIFECLRPDTYYVSFNDGDTDCLTGWSFTIKEEKIYSVAGIKEIYCAEWDDTVDWNYWSTENDPDYYAPAGDTLRFQSTKIAEYTDTGMTWYYIPVDPQNVNFSQNLEKVRQGFIFRDELTIAFSIYDESQWSTLTSVLAKKYLIVFKDNNDQWWTFGYRHGAETTSYTFGSADAGFKFSFSAVSENKIITAIDEAYVNTYIK